ncbi:PREDICTED: psbP domain-containing protein 3, chloroplastic [Tarenaya hassleriana]|uniref:psbP domain-containing protein 3, chloroplastic n=1 Tax=Tarenaya hassleriana TaxID=28532 RepID=UPI00053CA2F8|nr:PREDICTED: psbP domain-containing protein 3, chloroplastic [Tarenaya hassleriana]
MGSGHIWKHMAAVSSFHSPSLSFSIPRASAPPSLSNTAGFRRCMNRSIICSQDISEQDLQISSRDQLRTNRREIMFQMAYSVSILPLFASPAFADTNVSDNFRMYTDESNKFAISIPQDWQIGKGDSDGYRSITAFYPEEAASTSNVSVVITGLGPDFTRMESFGKVDEFAETLVSGLDRSWQRPPGVKAKLVDSKSSKGFYYIEYTLQNPGETRKNLYSAIGMASTGWYNRLYTVTGQFSDDESDKYSSMIEKTVKSFRFI